MPDVANRNHHPFLTAKNVSPFARSLAIHHLGAPARKNITGQTSYLADTAHYPARLNGRAMPFYSGAKIDAAYPWTTGPQPVTDAYGLIFWRAAEHVFLWSVTAGARVLTVKLKHQAGAGPRPQLVIDANPALNVAAVALAAPVGDNIEHTLTANVSPAIAGTLVCRLVTTRLAEGKKTTWGDILTT